MKNGPAAAHLPGLFALTYSTKTQPIPNQTLMTKARLIIVHGFMASPANHWFTWLKARAEALGMEVVIPAMPDSAAPDAQRWQETLRQQVGQVDDRTFFVGHSLGCITALRYLSQRPDKERAGGIIMVSGFSEPVPTLPELDAFTAAPPVNLASLTGIAHRAVIASLNDEIVAPEYSLRLSQRLVAPLYGLPDGGHFLDRDGFDMLPLAETLLKQFITP